MPLLTESAVSEQSGLAGPLVKALIPRVPTPAGQHYDRTLPAYPEDSVYRAQSARILLDIGVRLGLVAAGCRGDQHTAEDVAHLAELAEMYRAAHQLAALRETIRLAGEAGMPELPGSSSV